MPVELRETRLPGIGVKYGFRTSDGGRLSPLITVGKLGQYKAFRKLLAEGTL